MRYLIAAIAVLGAAVLAVAVINPLEGERMGTTVAATSTISTSEEIINHYPRISLIYPRGGEVLSGTVTIRWEVSDPDGDPVAVTLAVTDEPFPTCATCPPQEWVYIAVNVSGTGSVEWDTSSVPDGEYMLMIEAYDGKALARAYSDWFVVRNG